MRISVLPDEAYTAYTPLLVNGNGMLAGAIPVKFVETVARWIAKVFKSLSSFARART
jgi:hypothetical protein